MTPAIRVDTIPSWFVALPDHEPAAHAVTELLDKAPHRIDHPSGRPWVLGHWPDRSLAVGGSRTTTLALIGQHAATGAELSGAARQMRSPGDLERFAATVVGSCHLLASVDGQVRVQGTVTGVRRVYHARFDATTIAADRADILAGLLGTGLDPTRLALHLMSPPVLYPLAGLPVWRGVDLVPTDHALLLDGRGRARIVRWWTPPEPVLPMAAGADRLREAMSAAVRARVRDHQTVSCDLGGVDSTAVCSLAARGPATVLAYTAASQDPLSDDVPYARRTVAALNAAGAHVEHHVIPAERMPLVYHGLLDMDEPLDEPCGATVDRERWLVIARLAAEAGSALHLTGFGGDELLHGSLSHLHTLARSRPLSTWRTLRGFAVKYRWPTKALLRQLGDNRPYHLWLGTVAGCLTAPPPVSAQPLLEWGFRPRLAPWVTPEAAFEVDRLVREHADRKAEPLAARRGQHRELETMRFVSRLTRQLDQMANRFGVTLSAPYYDDRVVEAGLAVRPQDRVTPWRYKPLLREAMRGIVPDHSLDRHTKANGTVDEDTGMRQNRAQLLALWDDSRLADLGLVDERAVREACTRPMPRQLDNGVLYQTVACEVWLRTLERVATQQHRGDP
ncbi:MAG TPA: asparagine synthase-related protein [Micromonosporaceae bacterium]